MSIWKKSLSDNCKNILDEQYRMNPVIGDLISKLFYESKLVSKTSKEEKTIPLKLYESKPLVGFQLHQDLIEKKNGF